MSSSRDACEKELERIQFVINRDGISGALQFASRTYAIYRSAIRNSRCNPRHHPYGKVYREELIASCFTLRSFLIQNGVTYV